MDIKEILTQHKIYIESFGSNGKQADLTCADLRGADFLRADLRCSDLRGADLRSADFHRADLRGADLRSADLRCSDLRGADLRSADFHRADLPYGTFIILGEVYFVSIENGENLRAECQSHTIESWFKFSKKEIMKMDGNKALKFYPRLLDIIDFYVPNHGFCRPEWIDFDEMVGVNDSSNAQSYGIMEEVYSLDPSERKASAFNQNSAKNV
jgi:hypothetical protein